MLYFAYGSNMDRVQMADRCPGSERHAVGSIAGCRFLINSRGVASVAPSEGDLVHGLVWSLTPADEASLDWFEGVALGLYTKDLVTALLDGGREAHVLIYTAADNDPGQPRAGYLERIVAAARAAGLPAEYISELEGWAGAGASD